MPKTIAVDLDGTLVHWDQWVTPTTFGEPIPEMVARVKKHLLLGDHIWIFTARLWNELHGHGSIHDAISALSRKLFNRVLPMTAVKLPIFDEIWDDRARQVEVNTGRFVGRGL